ncbi:MAG TPA: metallophosphoesterase [Gemmatimonadales bacterium]|nr:metallophosphoesterase [Gemmatimonadales bacterium]
MSARFLRPPRLALLVALAAAPLAGCTHTYSTPQLVTPKAAPIAPRDIELSLFLIGDAGAPAKDEPVLAALTRQVEAAQAGGVKPAIVFLGDNVYPRGLPDTGALTLPTRPEAERRLQAQIDVALRTRTPTWFIPGNHDWAYMTAAGWDAIKRQVAYIQEHGAPYAQMQPTGGCPGPVYADLSPHVRLIMLDTQWWLHDYARPVHPDSDCPYDAPGEIVNAMNRQMLSAGGRQIVVVGHHPLASGGEHGGNLTLTDHLFPLRMLSSSLWIPLPIAGSYYALNRQQGASNQDLAGPKNQAMRRAFEVVFERRKPLVYAAGHDHEMQVFDGRTVRHILVSGAGIYGHVSRVAYRANTRYAAEKSGYMRIDFRRDGRARLGVIVVDEHGVPTEDFSMELK